MKKTFADYVMENTIAEKDLEGGKFFITDLGETISFRYSKGNQTNVFMLEVGKPDEYGPEFDTLDVLLKVNGKEVIMNGLPREKFIMKMREFLAKIK